MKYKAPLIVPEGFKLWVTQRFHANHWAVDFAINGKSIPDNERVSYASQLVWSLPEGKVISLTENDPMNDRGNGVRVETQLPNGRYLSVVYWHCSFVDVKVGQVLKFGDKVSKMGNSGFCVSYQNGEYVRVPTKEFPLKGVHCHLSTETYLKNEWGNYDIKVHDPEEFFDFSVYFTGEDTDASLDAEPFKWVFAQTNMSAFEKLMFMLKHLGVK